MNTHLNRPPSPKQILFVDDEAPTRELVSLHLRNTGYDVTTAMTAGQARDTLKTGRFDLAVLDLDLAGESGLELLTHCKARTPAMPVILFTGLNLDQDLLKEARSRGADGCMSKTQPLKELAAEVKRLLPL